MDSEVTATNLTNSSDTLCATVETAWLAVTSTPRAMTTREIEDASAEDEGLSELRNCIAGGTWTKDQLKQYIPVASELCVIGKLILRGTRIVIPSKLRSRVLTLAHEGHPGIVSMKHV